MVTTATLNGAAEQTASSIVQIADWLRLFREPGEVTELRAVKVIDRTDGWTYTASGFFDYDHLDLMAKEAARLSRISQGVYFVMNPLKPEIIHLCFNRVRKCKGEEGTANDGNVLKRRWLLIDADPERPVKGIPSTDAEKRAALATILLIREHLDTLGWPPPIFADSGNGYHLLYPIDLLADDKGIVKRCLNTLAQQFDSTAVTVDQTVFNPARICKLYGTSARKGDDHPLRPHRCSKVLEVPAWK